MSIYRAKKALAHLIEKEGFIVGVCLEPHHVDKVGSCEWEDQWDKSRIMRWKTAECGRQFHGSHVGFKFEELNLFEWEIQEEMAAKVCHPVRVAVLAESGNHKIFVVQPKERSNGDT